MGDKDVMCIPAMPDWDVDDRRMLYLLLALRAVVIKRDDVYDFLGAESSEFTKGDNDAKDAY